MTSYRSRNFMLAASLALVSGLLTTLYVANAGSAETVGGPAAQTVLVAAKDVPAGTPAERALASGMLELRTLPRAAVVPGAVASRRALRGRVAVDAIHRGEQVTARRFASARAAGVFAELSGTMRALKIAGDANQVLAGVINAGDRVDVVAALEGTTGRPAFGRIVLRDVLVLRAPEKPADGSLAAAEATHAVTLRLTDRQAQQLFFVAKTGDWALILRPAFGAADSPDGVETAGTVLRGGS